MQAAKGKVVEGGRIVAQRNSHAVIRPRRNGTPRKTHRPSGTARNDALRAAKRLGRAIWRRWSGHHRRSRVEAKMNGVELLGQKLCARDFDRRIAERQNRIAILNRHTTLGIPMTRADA